MMAFGIAAVVYLATLLLGVVAAIRGQHFGRLHHAGYFASCTSALAASIAGFVWPVVVPLLCLATLPFTRGGTTAHYLVGAIGAIGWIVVLIAGWDLHSM